VTNANVLESADPHGGNYSHMDNDNILVEREFDISLDGQSHKVKATAAFLVHGFEFTPGGMKEEGAYLLNFTLRGQQAEMFQPDKARYSREQARRAAELAFNSGEVEAYARSQIQSWIHLGL
jgi:hypothetical protein